MKKTIFYGVAIMILVSGLPGCKSMNKTQKGTAIGAGAGAAAGALIGGGGKRSVIGALIGAAVGGGAGYVIGHHMDKKAEEVKQAVPDATVERVGEGINVTFNSGLLFKINSSTLSDAAKESLAKAAGVFIKDPETVLLVEGHTDDTGPLDFNMELSKKRAYAVAEYLQSKGVASNRFDIKWYGPNQPKVPNTSEANRASNRRVELAIMANNDMKEKAKAGKLD